MLITERLRLRQWCDDDYAAFAALNADPEVCTFLGPPLTSAQSDAMAARLQDAIASRGWGWWAVEVAGGAPFIGFVGLTPIAIESHFTPATEIGWRLARAHWGKGYATEAAAAAMAFGFEQLGLEEVVSFTTVANARSRRVMERLGMTRDPQDDFDHPRLAPDNPLRRHVLYRLAAPSRR